MALKTFKPYTKSTRGTVLVSREGLWKGKPYKPLTSANNASKEEITMEELPLETMEVVTNINTEKLIFIEKNSICRQR